MVKKTIGIVLISVLLLSFAIAKISLSEPEDIYNLGDSLYISADGIIGSNSGNLNIDLVCGNKTLNLVKIPSRAFSTEKEQHYSVPYKILNEDDLEIANSSEIVGTCQVVASMGSQGATSKKFTISNKISVSATLNKTIYDPKEGITININAVKENGDLLNGFVEVTGASSFSKAIEKGVVIETFSMPENAEAGEYNLEIVVYDKGKNGMLNSGKTSVSFKINQVPTSVVLSLSESEILPGSNLTIGSEIFDQSGKKIEGTVFVKVISPNDEEITKSLAAGSFISLDFPSNATAGSWDIVSEFSSISDKREFVVLEMQKAEFEFEDSVLIVKNIGNTVYNKSISIKIGDKEEKLDGLSIGIGETRKFNIRAPDGQHHVVVNDGESSVEADPWLTGKAISIDDLKNSRFSNYWVAWIFLILILAGTGAILLVRSKKTKTVGKSSFFEKMRNLKYKLLGRRPIEAGKPPLKSPDKTSSSNEGKNIIDLTKSKLTQAESTLVLKGDRYRAAIISLKVKNYSSLGDSSKSSLKEIILNNTEKNKGLVDWKDDHIFLVFTVLASKTYNNESLAVKTGSDIFKSLKEHNRKFSNKINFNIAIHAGEIIASKEEGKLKYTGFGNTVALPKRMSDLDDEKLLISDEIRKKLVRDLRVIKNTDIGNNPIYEVLDVKDKEINETKLKDLLKRM